MADAPNVIIPVPPGVVKFTGPLFLAYCFNWALWGALSIQCYQYRTDYPLDRWPIKTIVAVVYVLETFETFMLTSSGFNVFGYGYGNVIEMDKFGPGWITIPVTSGLVALIAHSFYAYRISVLARSHKFTYIIIFLTLCQFVGAMVIVYYMNHFVFWSKFFGKEAFILAGFWEGGSALCDVVIAACMIYYLRKRDTKIKKTQEMLGRLITLTVGTGAVTACVALFTLIVTYVPTDIGFYQVPGANIGKLYAVSILVVLNARKRTSAQPSTTSISNEMHVILPYQSQNGPHSGSQGNVHPENMNDKMVPAGDSETGIRIHREIMVQDDRNGGQRSNPKYEV